MNVEAPIGLQKLSTRKRGFLRRVMVPILETSFSLRNLLIGIHTSRKDRSAKIRTFFCNESYLFVVFPTFVANSPDAQSLYLELFWKLVFPSLTGAFERGGTQAGSSTGQPGDQRRASAYSGRKRKSSAMPAQPLWRLTCRRTRLATAGSNVPFAPCPAVERFATSFQLPSSIRISSLKAW